MVAWDVVPEPPHTDGPSFLRELLIDREHQTRGYGRQAVELRRPLSDGVD